MQTNTYTDERIVNQIYVIRGQRIMIDSDLAELYAVENKRLKEAVRRNLERFPEDFMFQISAEELVQLKSSNSSLPLLKYRPYCFTEQGVTMLSCVLNSNRAIQMNIRIIRLFTQMREAICNHKELRLKIELLEQKILDHDESLTLILESIKELLQREEIRTRTNDIGFNKTRK